MLHVVPQIGIAEKQFKKNHYRDIYCTLLTPSDFMSDPLTSTPNTHKQMFQGEGE